MKEEKTRIASINKSGTSFDQRPAGFLSDRCFSVVRSARRKVAKMMPNGIKVIQIARPTRKLQKIVPMIEPEMKKNTIFTCLVSFSR